MLSSATAMILQPGMNPALDRWNKPGKSLRRARSPVAPNRTTTCGNCGPTPAEILAIVQILSGLLTPGEKECGRVHPAAGLDSPRAVRSAHFTNALRPKKAKATA